MKIRKDIINTHWEKAAIDELAENYKNKGYEVLIKTKFGDQIADLIAKKDDEVIIFEIKSGTWDKAKLAQIKELRNSLAHSHKGKFKLVLASPPQDKSIDINGLEEILDNLIQEHYQDTEVTSIATHIECTGVDDFTVLEAIVNKQGIEIKGQGIASFNLLYGSSSDREKDNGAKLEDSFPFSFHLLLGHELNIIEVKQFEIDVTSFHE